MNVLIGSRESSKDGGKTWRLVGVNHMQGALRGAPAGAHSPMRAADQDTCFSPVPLAVVFQCVPSTDSWNITATLSADANL